MKKLRDSEKAMIQSQRLSHIRKSAHRFMELVNNDRDELVTILLNDSRWMGMKKRMIEEALDEGLALPHSKTGHEARHQPR